MEDVKEILMIHEVTEDILKLDLSKYILTFDDGLYSQYFYWNILKDIPTPKIFFIPTASVNLDSKCRPQFDGSYKIFPTCRQAMKKWFEDNEREDYLTLGELKKMQSEGAIIGAHGHQHVKDYNSCFITRLEEFRKDNCDMKDWFEDNLGKVPESYCFPYNKEYSIMRAVIRAETGITDFYGEERKAVEELL